MSTHERREVTDGVRSALGPTRRRGSASLPAPHRRQHPSYREVSRQVAGPSAASVRRASACSGDCGWTRRCVACARPADATTRALPNPRSALTGAAILVTMAARSPVSSEAPESRPAPSEWVAGRSVGPGRSTVLRPAGASSTTPSRCGRLSGRSISASRSSTRPPTTAPGTASGCSVRRSADAATHVVIATKFGYEVDEDSQSVVSYDDDEATATSPAGSATTSRRACIDSTPITSTSISCTSVACPSIGLWRLGTCSRSSSPKA